MKQIRIPLISSNAINILYVKNTLNNLLESKKYLPVFKNGQDIYKNFILKEWTPCTHMSIIGIEWLDDLELINLETKKERLFIGETFDTPYAEMIMQVPDNFIEESIKELVIGISSKETNRLLHIPEQVLLRETEDLFGVYLVPRMDIHIRFKERYEEIVNGKGPYYRGPDYGKITKIIKPL